MRKSKTLYLLSATFPYGSRETFLEAEIKYLSSVFQRIVIIPLAGNIKNRREIPSNCIALNPIIENRFKQYLHLFSLKGFRLFVGDFFKKRVWCNKQRLKSWSIAYILFNNYICSKQIKIMLRELASDDVVYSYWGKGGCYLAPILKGKAKIVSRFHGEWDLWEESSGNYAPVRNIVANSLSLAVFISLKGEIYFKQRYNCPTLVSRLGTINSGNISEKSSDGVLRIVSCSSVYQLKRVPLIYQAIQLIEDIPIEWTHIGGGVDFEKLKIQVKTTRDNVSIRLLGEVPNKEVLNYYKNEPVDLFINVSANEGVPVSIMEAISYNIPVIATDVGSSSEIVTPETGLLISANPTFIEIKKAILKVASLSIIPRLFWEKNYNADINYRLFAKTLFEL